MIKMICRYIWNLSEATGIGLGRFAPIVFSGMIGAKGKKVNEKMKTKTAGGRILKNVYSVKFTEGKWYPASGGKMTILEAQKEAKRRNEEAKNK